MDDALALGLRSLQSLARIGWDALAEPLGGALPLAPERVAEPGFLEGLLARHPGPSLEPGVRLAGAELLDVRAVSSNCNNRVLAWEARGIPALPATAFLKLPSPELATRAFCDLLGIWRLECRFYRDLAPRVPIRVPQAYAIATRGTRFVLLLEDLGRAQEIELFTNPDMLAGASLEQARRCLSTLAELHAAFHGLGPDEREALLPLALHPFLSPRLRSAVRGLNASAVAPCARKAPAVFTPDLVALYRRVLGSWDALLGAWFREPLTLIHGDSHLGNFFAEGDRMGMLDFQAAQWAPGLRDVQYFLINSLPEEILAREEKGLIAWYAEELGRHGVTLSADEALTGYRGLSFQTLMTHVVSLGLGPLTEKNEVMERLLARAAAAVRRLDFAGWLDDLLGAGDPLAPALVREGTQ